MPGLILTRYDGESIIIDGNIQVKLDRAIDGKATISVLAPPDVTVDRLEIHKRKLVENQNIGDC